MSNSRHRDTRRSSIRKGLVHRPIPNQELVKMSKRIKRREFRRMRSHNPCKVQLWSWAKKGYMHINYGGGVTFENSNGSAASCVLLDCSQL